MSRVIEMDIMCELASAIVERQWDKENHFENHSYEAPNGDLRYHEDVQDEFNQVLDIIDTIVNGEDSE